ncbi:MAG: hypothetical protein ACOX88_10570, partial [Christensenellales bacterium]
LLVVLCIVLAVCSCSCAGKDYDVKFEKSGQMLERMMEYFDEIKSYEKSYPDWFFTAYADRTGNLVVVVRDDSQEIIDLLETFSDDADYIVKQKPDYRYKKVLDAHEKIEAYYNGDKSGRPNEGNLIGSYRVDDIDECNVVTLINYNLKNVQRFRRDVTDSPSVRLLKSLVFQEEV